MKTPNGNPIFRFQVAAVLFPFLLFSLVEVFPGCGGSGASGPPKGQKVEFTGTVTDDSPTPGKIGIVGDDGNRYIPLLLPPGFASPGAKVRVSGILTSGAPSEGWKKIDLLSIKSFAGPNSRLQMQ